MSESISFFATGTPKGQPRPRAFAFHGKARVYDPGTAEGWKSAVAVAAQPHRPREPISKAVALTLDFYIPRPKAHFKKENLRPDAPHWCAKKPDADNYAKAVMDALTVLRFWDDDSQVVQLIARKKYDTIGGCFITIATV